MVLLLLRAVEVMLPLVTLLNASKSMRDVLCVNQTGPVRILISQHIGLQNSIVSLALLAKIPRIFRWLKLWSGAKFGLDLISLL